MTEIDLTKSAAVREVIGQLKRFRIGKRLEGLSLREMIAEGRR